MNLQLAAPIFLGVAAAASIWTIALHLISFRVPEPLPLPTARFVPSGRTRLLAARLVPSDLDLLAVRVFALLLAGLAMAGPTLMRKSGTALVVVADVSRAVADRDEVRDSVAALMRGGRSISLITFDSAAQLTDPAELVSPPVVPDAPGALAPALLLAIREGERLRSGFDSVSIVVISPLVTEQHDAALGAIRNTWSGSLTLLGVATAIEADDSSAAGRVVPSPEDPAAAAIAAALVPQSARSLRVVRTPPGPADSALARAGAVVLYWPAESATDTQSTPAAVLARSGAAAVVHRTGNAVVGPDSGSVVVMRWQDGGAAASVTGVGAGCIRSVAPGLELRGDEPLRPAFLAVVGSLVAPCAQRDFSPMKHQELLTSTGSTGLEPLSPVPSPWLVRALIVLSLFMLLFEWWLRSRRELGAQPPKEAS
ncbi:MAG: hypothetical protein ACT4OZ_11865 [Gemmatimonadota bacterium]